MLLNYLYFILQSYLSPYLFRAKRLSALEDGGSGATSEIDRLREENATLRRQLESLSVENMKKQLEFKDGLVREIGERLKESRARSRALEEENAQLSAQVLMQMQQLQGQMQGQAGM